MTNWHQTDFALIHSGDAVQKSVGKRRAILAASDVYRNARLASLSGSERLLVETAELLKTRGAFDVTLVLGSKMTRPNLIREIDRVCANAEPDDCLLFYFVGHGGFLLNDRDSLALLLADYDWEDQWKALTARDLGIFLKSSNNGTVIVVLDTSFASSAYLQFQ
jgi:hypothetical protein